MTTSSPRRRDLLRGVGGTAALLVAGCLESASPATDDDEDDTDATTTALESHDSIAFQHDRRPSKPGAALFDRPADVGRWLEHRDSGDAADLEAFVADTAFDNSVVLALEGDGRNLCYELVLEDVALEGGAGDGDDDGDDGDTDHSDDPRLTLEAAVRDESDDDELCAPQMTAVGRLVRATFTGGSVTEATVTITDAEGETHAIDVDVKGSRKAVTDESDDE